MERGSEIDESDHRKVDRAERTGFSAHGRAVCARVNSNWFGAFALGYLLSEALFETPAPATIAPPTWLPQIALVEVPLWVFIGAWTVLFPTYGLVIWLVWSQRRDTPVERTLGLLSFPFVSTLLWNPLIYTVDQAFVPFVIDIVGVVIAPVTIWAVNRVSKRGAVILGIVTLWTLFTTYVSYMEWLSAFS